MTPFYYQSEPGKYSLPVTCPHCAKEWYVVWDANPGPIEPLTGFARSETLGEAVARTGMGAEDVVRSWMKQAERDPSSVKVVAVGQKKKVWWKFW